MSGPFTQKDWILEKTLKGEYQYLGQRDNWIFLLTRKETDTLFALNLENGSREILYEWGLVVKDLPVIWYSKIMEFDLSNSRYPSKIALYDGSKNILFVLSLLPESRGKIIFSISYMEKSNEKSFFISTDEEYLLFENRETDSEEKKWNVTRFSDGKIWRDLPRTIPDFREQSSWNNSEKYVCFAQTAGNIKTLTFFSKETSQIYDGLISGDGSVLEKTSNSRIEITREEISVRTALGGYHFKLWGSKQPISISEFTFLENPEGEKLEVISASKDGVICESRLFEHKYVEPRRRFPPEWQEEERIPFSDRILNNGELDLDFTKYDSNPIYVKNVTFNRPGSIFQAVIMEDGKRALFFFQSFNEYFVEIYTKKEYLPEKDKLLMKFCAQNWRESGPEQRLGLEVGFGDSKESSEGGLVALYLPRESKYFQKYNREILLTYSRTIREFLEENPDKPFPLPNYINQMTFENFWEDFFQNKNMAGNVVYEYLNISF